MTLPSQPLITSRLAAVIAALATGIVAFLAIREAIFDSAKRPGWILSPFHSWPFWFTVVANGVFYLFALWMLALLFRDAKGKERVVAAGWLLGWALLPAEAFSSDVSVIRCIGATAWGAAFLTALAILEIRTESGVDDQKQIGSSRDEHS